MNQASFSGRYLAKLISNLVTVAINFLTLTFITRALTPSDYSQYEFATAIFTNLISGTGIALPIAYFVWASKNDNEKSLGTATWLTLSFYIAQFLAFFIFTLISIAGDFSGIFWPGVSSTVLLLGLSFASSNAVLDIFARLGDARALTKQTEIRKTLQSCLRCASVISLVYAHTLDSVVLLWVSIAVNLFGIVTVYSIMQRAGVKALPSIAFWLKTDERKNFLRFAFDYIKPLVAFTLLSVLVGITEKWLVQNSGSEQFGYYALAYKICTLSSLFLTAATPIFTRDIARLRETANIPAMRSAVGRLKYFLGLATFFSAITFTYAPELVYIIGGGTKFAAAIPILKILAFFPIHQTLGQFCGSYFYAGSQTKLFSVIQTITTIVGCALSYFLLAPKNWIIPGLDLGAEGYAWKIIILNIFGNQALLWYVTKDIQDSFKKWIGLQIVVICQQFLIAWVCHRWIIPAWQIEINSMQLTGIWNNVLVLASGAALQGAVTILLLAMLPRALGFNENDRSEVFSLVRSLMRLNHRKKK